MSEIKIVTSKEDGKPIFYIENAMITFAEEVRRGVSQRTGNEWKLQNINVRLDLGEGAKSGYMRLTVGGRVLDKLSTPLSAGQKISAEVDFNISSGSFQYSEVRVINLINQ